MTSRDRTTLGVAGVLLLLAAAWFLLLSPQREAAKTADRGLSAARSRLAAAQATAVAPKQQQTDVRDQITVARLGKAVPADVNVPALIVQLQQLARKADVDFQGLTLGGPAADASAATPGTGTTTTPAATTTPTTASPAAGATTAAGATPPGTVVDSAGYTTLPLDLKLTGRYLDLQQFLASVDDLVRVRGSKIDVRGRLLTVQGIAYTTEGASSLNADVTATAYLAPEDVLAIQQIAQMPTSASAAAEGATGAADPAPAAATTETDVR